MIRLCRHHPKPEHPANRTRNPRNGERRQDRAGEKRERRKRSGRHPIEFGFGAQRPTLCIAGYYYFWYMRSYPAVVTHPQERSTRGSESAGEDSSLLVVCAVSAPCVAASYSASAAAVVSWLHANEAWVPERCWKPESGSRGSFPAKSQLCHWNAAFICICICIILCPKYFTFLHTIFFRQPEARLCSIFRRPIGGAGCRNCFVIAVLTAVPWKFLRRTIWGAAGVYLAKTRDS